MTAVLFSVPVHESNETILTTISNVRRFNGLQHHIMLHVDANWDGFDPGLFNIQNVHINPVRFPTYHAHSQVATHLSNFRRGLDMKLDFQFFAVLHTSEMFIRRGMHDSIAFTDHSLWFTPDNQPHEMSWPPLANAVATGMFKGLFQANRIENYLGNLIEGSWWRKELFMEISRWAERNYNLDEMGWGWAAEEVFFPTLAWHLGGSELITKHPYCAFKHDEHYLQDKQFVDDIRANRPVTFWQPHNFTYGYAPFPSNGLFTVKRIARDITDPMRVYISYLGD